MRIVVVSALVFGLLAACSNAGNGVTPLPVPSASRGGIGEAPTQVRDGRFTLLLLAQSYFTDSISGYPAYPSPNKPPLFRIPFKPIQTSREINGPIDVASDSSGRVYTTFWVNELGAPFGYFAVYDHPLSNPATPDQVVRIRPGDFSVPGAIGVDRYGRVYVGEGLSSRILVFAPAPDGSLHVIAHLGSPAHPIGNFRVDASGMIYTNSGDSIAVYAAGRFGDDVAPIRTITSSSADLSDWEIHALAVRYDGTIYTANDRGADGEVLAFPPGANGDVKPILTIRGTRTRLYNVNGIAVCSDGTIYVGDSIVSIDTPPAAPPPSIAVFAPGSNGNAAPQRLIGAAAGVENPGSLNF